jgi:hypothetical protein
MNAENCRLSTNTEKPVQQQSVRFSWARTAHSACECWQHEQVQGYRVIDR